MTLKIAFLLKHYAYIHVDYGCPSISRLASTQTQSNQVVLLRGSDHGQTKGKL